jgi:aspartate 1-decarboxylase
MNKVVKAGNKKIAAIDYAAAVEISADGIKRSKIKEAEAIKLVNDAADKYFIGN